MSDILKQGGMDVIKVNFHNENCMAAIATACGFCVQQIELLRCQYHLFVTNLYCVLVVFIYKANVTQLRTN